MTIAKNTLKRVFVAVLVMIMVLPMSAVDGGSLFCSMSQRITTSCCCDKEVSADTAVFTAPPCCTFVSSDATPAHSETPSPSVITLVLIDTLPHAIPQPIVDTETTKGVIRARGPPSVNSTGLYLLHASLIV